MSNVQPALDSDSMANPSASQPGAAWHARRRAAGRVYLYGGLFSLFCSATALVVPWVKDPPRPSRFSNQEESLAHARQWAADMDRIVVASSRSTAASERLRMLIDSRADLASRATADSNGQSALAAVDAEIAAAWEESMAASRSVQELCEAEKAKRKASEQADAEAVEQIRWRWFLTAVLWSLPLVAGGVLALLRVDRARRRDLLLDQARASRAE